MFGSLLTIGFRRFLGTGVLLIFLSRLPVFLGGNLYLDSDEAVVGLMAIELLRGEGVAVFFWGQNYGLTIVESGLGALLFAVFGVSDVALRVAMLALWSSGWLLFALALRDSVPHPWSRWIPLLLVFCPAWGVWSTAPRGGYVTAFVLVNLILWLLAQVERRPSAAVFAACGAAFGLLCFAQRVFAATLAPFLVLVLWPHVRRPALLWGVVGGALAVLGTVLLHAGKQSFVWAPDFFEGVDPVTGLSALPGMLFGMFGGLHLYDRAAFGPCSAAAAAAWLAVLVAAAVLAGRALARRGARAFELAFAAALLLALAMSVFLGWRVVGQYRYLLPIPVLLLLYACARVSRGPAPRRAAALTAVLCAVGAAALVEVAFLSRFEGGNRRQDIRALVGELQQAGVHHVYSIYPLQHWDLMFYSEGSLQARSFQRLDRRPQIVHAVDRALHEGRKTALVGWGPGGIDHLKPYLAGSADSQRRFHAVRGRAFWFADPEPALLRKLGFDLGGEH